MIDELGRALDAWGVDVPSSLSTRLMDGHEIVNVLRATPGITTLLIKERRSGELFVMKAARADLVPTTTLVRFEHDAGLLEQLDERRVPAPRRIEANGAVVVVRRFVPGVPLRGRLQEGPLPVREVIRLAQSVGSALAEVHEAGVLHGALKPENIVVDATDSLEWRLVDFGFARGSCLPADQWDEANAEHHPARYTAPEQAGLLHRAQDERSDLYSLGVVLFECLSGRLLFDGESLGAVLRQHLTWQSPTLRSFGVSVPHALERLVQRLLRKEPDERYQSVEGVLADLGAIAHGLEQGIADPDVAIGGRDNRRTLTEPAFIGRDHELARLQQQLDRAQRGDGGLVLLEAPSGGGKTRLLDEFEQHAVESGALVVRGTGTTARRPLNLLSAVASSLVQAAPAEPVLAGGLRQRLRDHRAVLVAMWPELEEILDDGSPKGSRGSQYGEHRTLIALASMLDAVGSCDQPAVILLDDYHWAEDLEIRLLDAWSRLPAPPEGRHVVVVAAFRTEEISAQHPLRVPAAGEHVRLGPLSAGQTRQMVESMAGPIPTEGAVLLNNLSEGNPFLIAAVLRGLLESGALLAEESGWRIDLEAAATAQASREAAAFLAQRIGTLPPEMLRLLEVGAVLGREFDLDFAISLSRHTPATALEIIDDAHRRHLVWVRGATCTFVHDRVREAILERLDVATRAGLHLRAASEMEHTGIPQSYELAHHYAAAGFHERAMPHALRAAEEARSRHSLQTAERQYRIAEQGAVGAGAAVQGEIAERLGQVLMLRGRYDDARRYLLRARELSDDQLTQARVEGELGELAFKGGDLPEATRRIEQALRMLGKHIPRRRPTFVLALVWELLVQAVYTLRPPIRRRNRSESSEKEVLAARLHTLLSYTWFPSHSALTTCWVNFRQLNVAERQLTGLDLALAYAAHIAVVQPFIPRFHGRGERFAARARDIYDELDDPWGRSVVESFHGVMLYAAGHYRDGVTRCQSAIGLLEPADNPWELMVASWHGALCHYRMGNLGAAAQQGYRVHEMGLDLREAMAVAEGLEIWVKANRGRVPAAVFQTRLAALEISEGDVQTKVSALQAEGCWLLATDRVDNAIAIFEEAVRLVDSAGSKNVYVASAFPWLATARRLAVERADPLDPRARRRLIQRARGAARRAQRWALVYRTDRPHALREAALISAMSGHDRRARRCLDRSIEVAERSEALAELSESLLARAEVGRTRGWRGADADRTRGEELLGRVQRQFPSDAPTGGSPTMGMAERFSALLDAGRRIVSAPSLPEIFLRTSDAALALLRAEDCQIIHLDDDKLRQPPATGMGGQLVHEAIELGRPVVAPDGSDTLASLSEGSSRVRSALCAPILQGGVARAAMLATHSQVSELFGEEEERLAAFITALAGAAIERHHLEQAGRKQVIAVQEAERGRIARDLHDAIGQALTSVLLGLHLVHNSLEHELGEESAALSRLAELRSVTTEAVAEVRRLAFELRPAQLDDLGLAAALRRLTSDISSRHGLRIAFAEEEGGEQERLRSDVETAVYRVVQEALTNVIRHARATTASVLMVRMEGRLRVVVEDDGVGFDVDRSRTSFGLQGMLERAGLVGGTLALMSAPGTGTSILLEVPLD